ncbi:PREDICTED: uncharacterized protein LOC109344019 isoform X1 [Lupinus angustifolius]|uniref:uncharacterized protein LOC109344019 isoform X1 n=1 Tax=Lupinus angustifolius TaxID=3871 RepID=UPI00092EC8A9|nr:PREDICTED: uncharacterized protein LOC109344019 isoform X1 [Lupinus angustifolius]
MEQLSAPASSASGTNSYSLSVSKPKFQKYALRSSTKSKDLNPDAPISSHSNRGRSTPCSVSKSVSVLDLSGKDKSGSVKPPRRYSVQAKTTATPSPKMIGNKTPISETRLKRGANSQGPQSRNQTPISEISRTSSRVRFNLLSSASYWLNQIKLSESATKHSISLGFFKLALEAGCEPFQKMQDELKSYVHRNRLVAELGEQVKVLFERYNIAESLEQSQVSEAISQVPEDGTRSSDDEIHCSSPPTKGTGNLKPKSLNTDCTQLTLVTTESTKKDTCQKNKQSQSGLREKLRMKSANSRPTFESGNLRSVKKPGKPHDSNKKSAVKKHGNKSIENEVPVSPSPAEDNAQGNKENMDVLATDVTTEVVV